MGNTAINSSLGTTITGALSNIDAYNHYSTSETWTGKYWIDGKKIYNKTITGLNISFDDAFIATMPFNTTVVSSYIFGFITRKPTSSVTMLSSPVSLQTENSTTLTLRTFAAYSYIDTITIFYTKTT